MAKTSSRKKSYHAPIIGSSLPAPFEDWWASLNDSIEEKGHVTFRRMDRLYGPIWRDWFIQENWTDEAGEWRMEVVRAYHKRSLQHEPTVVPPFPPTRTWRRMIARACGYQPRLIPDPPKAHPTGISHLVSKIAGPYIGPHKRNSIPDTGQEGTS